VLVIGSTNSPRLGKVVIQVQGPSKEPSQEQKEMGAQTELEERLQGGAIQRQGWEQVLLQHHLGRDLRPWAKLKWESLSMGRVHGCGPTLGLDKASEALWCPQGS